MRVRSFLPLAAVMFLGTAIPAAAEWQFWLYGGYNWTGDSEVTLKEAGTTTTFGSVAWDGVSFKMPPYWGGRVTYWFEAMPGWGVGVDYAHAKVVAERTGIVGSTFERLEFTNGINLLTGNVLYRYPLANGLTPYAGLGAGFAFPHVEVTTATSRTYEYQITGPTVQAQVGLEYAITPAWAAFAEYKFNYTWVDADLKGGGSLTTELATSQLLLGVSYKLR